MSKNSFADVKKLPTSARELYHLADKYIDLKLLFPNIKNKTTKGKPRIDSVTDYQVKKMRKALNTSVAMAGSLYYLERDFIKVRHSKKLQRYNAVSNMPNYLGGVLISGGAKNNTNVRISKKLELTYERGASEVRTVRLDATTEKTLIKSIEKHRARIESEDASYIGSNGTYIGPIENFPETSYKQGNEPTDQIITKSLYLYNKYAAMHLAGEKRTYIDKKTGKKYSKGVAAHMKDWGFSLYWQNPKQYYF